MLTIIGRRHFSASLLFLGFFVLYLRTAAPDIVLMDGVEYTLAGHVLGIPHPPGYPLFTILNKLFQLIPAGTLAYRSNVLCATTSCLGIVLLYLLFTLRWRSTPAAIVSAMSLGLSAGYWENAVKNEAYSLHLFFIIVLMSVLMGTASKTRAFLGTMFILGLSLTNHQVMLLFCPAIAIVILADSGLRRTCLRLLGPGLCLFIIGMSVYLVLILRSAQDPLMNRGEPRTLNGLMNVMGARFTMATTNIAGNPSSSSSLHVKHYWYLTTHEWAWPLLFLVPLGLAALLMRDKLFLVLTFTGWIVQFVIITFTFYTSGEDIVFMVEPFYLPAHLFMICWIGAGLAYIHKRTGKLIYGITPVALLVSLLPLLTHFRVNDQSANRVVKDWASNVMISAQDSAVLFVAVDEYFPLSYLQLVEKQRPDLTPVHAVALALEPANWWRRIPESQQPRAVFPIGADTPASIANFRERVAEGLARYLAQPSARPVLLAHFDSGVIPQGYAPMLNGITYMLQPDDRGEPSPKSSEELWTRYRRRGLSRAAPGISRSEWRILDNYTVSLNNLAGLYLHLNRPVEAAACFEQVMQIDPANRVARKYLSR